MVLVEGAGLDAKRKHDRSYDIIIVAPSLRRLSGPYSDDIYAISHGGGPCPHSSMKGKRGSPFYAGSYSHECRLAQSILSLQQIHHVPTLYSTF